MTIKQYRRDLTVNAPALIEGNDERIIEIAFSSEAEYTRTYFTESGEAVQLAEILLHGEENVDLSVINDNASLLWNHDFDRHLGVVVAGSARIDADRVGRALVKFSKVGQLANETYEKVIEGTLSKVSVGYDVISGKPDLARGLFIVDRWRPYELTLCSVPADSSVGVGRSLNTDSENPVEIEGNDVNVEEIKTPTEETREIEVVETVEIQETPEVVTHDNAEFTGTIEATQEIKETENEEGNSDSGNRSSDSESIPQDEINTNTVESEEVKTQEAETVEEEKIEEVEQPFTRSHEDTEEIRAIGKHLNISEDEIQRAIEDKEITVENFKARALNITTESKTFIKGKNTMTDTIQNLESKFDLNVALKEIAAGKPLSGAAGEYTQEEARKAAQRGHTQHRNGVYVPTSVFRAAATGKQNVESITPVTPVTQRDDLFVDMLFENTILAKLGIRTIAATGPVSLPSLNNSTVTSEFVAEGEHAGKEGVLGFKSQPMSMRTLNSIVPVTYQASQTLPGLGQIVTEHLLKSSRVAVEKAILGNIANANARDGLVKLLKDAGKVKQIDWNYKGFLKMIAELTDQGYAEESLSFATRGIIKADLASTLKDNVAGASYLVEGDRLAGRPIHASGVIAEDTMIFGDFSSLVVAEFGPTFIDVDDTTARASQGLYYRLWSAMDWAVLDHSALCVVEKAAAVKAK
ncbi:hypothetical protein JT459_000811 [Salmonella enterica]|nr:hypothetical protein [Salmonella enterica]